MGREFRRGTSVGILLSTAVVGSASGGERNAHPAALAIPSATAMARMLTARVERLSFRLTGTRRRPASAAKEDRRVSLDLRCHFVQRSGELIQPGERSVGLGEELGLQSLDRV